MTTPGSPPPGPLRVLVVDADRRVRRSLEGLIGLADDIKVVGTAGDVAAAMAGIEASPIDLVLIDPRLPELDQGLALIAQMRRHHPRLRVVALSCFAEMARPALLGGADAFVAKSGQPDVIVDVLRRTALRPDPRAAA